MRSLIRVLSPTALCAIAACSDGIATLPLAPAPVASIWAVEGGRGVQFLPPMVAATLAATATYDASARPVVSIVPGTSCAGTPIAVLVTGSSGPGAIKLDESDGTFHAVWHTKGKGLATAGQPDYRLCIHEDGAPLGYLDLDIVRSARERKPAPPGTLMLVLDAPLVMRFGITGSTPTVGPPASIVFTRQPATVGAGAPQGVAIEVRDANGNVVTGASGTVTVAITPGAGPSAGPLGGTTSVSITDGAAAFPDLVLTVAGAGYSLDATFGGMAATSAPFEVIPGPAAAMTLIAGDGQIAMVGTAVPIAPEVQLVDAFGNAVPGQLVTFSVGLGGGSVTGSSAATNALGRAAVGSWTLGPMFGANTLLVSSGSLGSGVVSATGTFMPPS